MATFREFQQSDPELAASVEGRFTAHLHHIMASLKRDGSPRVSGTEVRFVNGEAYLGSMPQALKAQDLQRDPRVAIHAAPIDVEMTGGDAKFSGRARLCDDAETQAFFEAIGLPAEHRDGLAFAIDIELATLTRVVDNVMIVDTWSAADGETRQARIG